MINLDSNTTIKIALQWATQRLGAYSDSPQLDAELLLAHALSRSRVYLYAHATDVLLLDVKQSFEHLIEQRSQGMPIAYLTGLREFWSIPLSVNPSTLIPRPETELLVECTLKQMAQHTLQSTPISILDLGTGSGAIAIALAKTNPHWQITACDQSSLALQTAQHNAFHLHLTNITFIQSDWFCHIPLQPFDAIVSNPPYLTENDPHLPQLRFEPQDALISGPDGLNDLRHIIKHSMPYLKPKGCLLLEHGYTQAPAVHKLMQQAGFEDIASQKDLQGHTRITFGLNTA